MPGDIVIGLYRTRGRAEDVRDRLVTEGVPAMDIELRELAHDTVIPPQATPQTMFSFMDWLFGTDLPQRYGVHVTNGETAVSVRGRTDKEIVTATATMKLFAPLHVEVVTPPEAAAALEREQARANKP